MSIVEGSTKYLGRRARNMKERGHRWSTGGTRPTQTRTVFIAAMAILLFLIVPEALSASASWQVGRGVVQKGTPAVLKLSLRNDGAPSREGVRIMGRWGLGLPGKRAFSAGELGVLSQLGSYSGEVELKKTAIIEVPLSALGTPPQGRTVLEIAVVTGSELTDGQAIPY